MADFVDGVSTKSRILSVGIKKSGGTAVGAAKSWAILGSVLGKKPDFVGQIQEVGWLSTRCRQTYATLGLQKVADFVGRVRAKSRILSVGFKKSGGSALGAAKTWATLGERKLADTDGRVSTKSRILSDGNQQVRCYVLGAAKTYASLGFQKVADFVGRVPAKIRILSVGIKKSGGLALGAAKTWATPWEQEVADFDARVSTKRRILSVGSRQKAGFCRSESKSRVAQHSVMQIMWATLGLQKVLNIDGRSWQKSRFGRSGFVFGPIPKKCAQRYKKSPVLLGGS